MALSGKTITFEALPTEWKPINKNCIILQLNGTAMKNSSCNGFQFIKGNEGGILKFQ